MSTAFHPDTDSLTVKVNQILEQFLRITAIKNDWDEILPLAEYEYNNTIQSSTKKSPFLINYGMNPRDIWPIEDKQVCNPASDLYAHYLEKIHQQVNTNLKDATAKTLKRHEKYGMKQPDFEIGQEVLVDTRYMNRHKLDK